VRSPRGEDLKCRGGSLPELKGDRPFPARAMLSSLAGRLLNQRGREGADFNGGRSCSHRGNCLLVRDIGLDQGSKPARAEARVGWRSLPRGRSTGPGSKRGRRESSATLVSPRKDSPPPRGSETGLYCEIRRRWNLKAPSSPLTRERC